MYRRQCTNLPTLVLKLSRCLRVMLNVQTGRVLRTAWNQLLMSIQPLTSTHTQVRSLFIAHNVVLRVKGWRIQQCRSSVDPAATLIVTRWCRLSNVYVVYYDFCRLLYISRLIPLPDFPIILSYVRNNPLSMISLVQQFHPSGSLPVCLSVCPIQSGLCQNG